MKSFVLAEPGIIKWKESEEPKITPYGAILRPLLVSPCSSDIHTIFGSGSPKQPDLILGHESIGEIIQIGEYVEDFKVGDIVAVPAITPNWRDIGIQEANFGHASAPFSGHQLGRTQPGVFAEKYLIKDADTTLAHIPSNVSIEQALMCVDVVTTGFTGAENANIKIGDTVCVMGIGPIGLMAIKGASLLGAANIIAVGSRKKCIQIAKEFGANQIINYKNEDVVKRIKKITNGIGVDATIIAGGNDEVFKQAIDITRYGIGTISNVNYFGGTGSLEFPKFSGGRGMAGKTIHTELAKGGRARMERILKMVEYNRIEPGKLITHNLYGIEKIEDAIYLMKDKPEDLIKVAVHIEY